jgi:hypothetical protein
MICPKTNCTYKCNANIKPHYKNKNCKSKPFSTYCPPCVPYKNSTKVEGKNG